MKTNKKLNLNTKKVVILSNDEQNTVQGGKLNLYTMNSCGQNTCKNCSFFNCGGSAWIC